MLSRLFGRSRERAGIATALYGAIVAAARAPGLYARLGVPDTVSGRFEMVVLHAFLVFDALQARRGGGARGRAGGCSTCSAPTWTARCASSASAISACPSG